MAVDPDFGEILFRNIKLDEPWLPPKPWESIPSESGGSISHFSNHTSSNDFLYDLPSLSEASLVRLVINALQGVQSAVVSIEKLSTIFNADPADRSCHRIPTLWNRSLSTGALGKILTSIGFCGTLVILLHKFVDYMACPSLDGNLTQKREAIDEHVNKDKDQEHPRYSIVNQAFAVSVKKVLEGYLCALDTINVSVQARRSFDNANLQLSSSQWKGSLTSVAQSDVTLLEVYLHTKELRTQVEALGNLCHLHDTALCFLKISFEELMENAMVVFHNFPRGADLLTYSYKQLQVVDPAHYTLLKYLFLRSLEPYCSFIRSWIYEAKINDPYGEFMVEYGVDQLPNSHGVGGIPVDFPLATVREQEVSLPCFLETISVPLLRAGQQLQVVMRLLQLCNYVHAGEYNFEDILPGLSEFLSGRVSRFPLCFNKEELEATVLSRRNFYIQMQEKLERVMETLEIKFHQVVLHDSSSRYSINAGLINSSTSDELQIQPSAVKDIDTNQSPQVTVSEASSVDEEFDFALHTPESSECSSMDDSEEPADCTNSHEVQDDLICPKETYLSALCFSSLLSDKDLAELSHTEQQFFIQNDLIDAHIVENIIRKDDFSDRRQVKPPRSWISEIEYASHVPELTWPLGALLKNPLLTGLKERDDGSTHALGSEQSMLTSDYVTLQECTSCSGDKSTPSGPLHEVTLGHKYPSANSFLKQSWNAKHPFNMLSMHPMFTKNAFLYDRNEPTESTAGTSKAFRCFDFSSARNPFKFYEDRVFADESSHVEPVLSSSTSAPTVQYTNDSGQSKNSAYDITASKECKKLANASLNLKGNTMVSSLINARGGSSLQSLLRGSSDSGYTTFRELEHGHRSEANFQIPLDFIIEKCLLQEIILQYIHVSRLSIKMLEQGFDLQEHFLALRRYHFMEIADWADLFIMSLWRHKWYFKEADQKIPEIQGLLELSIQRSSSERDHNKDRLYVYMKNQGNTPFVSATVGVHSFDFVGLGYRVDWPISIVLMPSALRIYAEIFTFLVQVKLAVLSLSDAWCSLKGFRHLFSQSNKWQKLAMRNFNYLVKLRHQVNHFVFTLQQYVLSQLSNIAWCRFHYSLKNEVKDMMDLESVHMTYLTDSRHICFLADDTQSISNNIQSILQCALDFRSCLLKVNEDVGSDDQDSMGSISQINLSQVSSLKEKFYKSLKELHKSYLKSPKHGKFGLSHFWSYLNYNEYYSDAFGNEICHYIPLVE